MNLNILPIRQIAEDDQDIFGYQLVNLGKLERSGLPVADGFGVQPPFIELHSKLEGYMKRGFEYYNQSLTLIKNDLKKIPLPENLNTYIKGNENFYTNEKIVSKKELWLSLLEDWLEEVRVKLWREGFNDRLTKNLTPALVFKLKNSKAFRVTVHYDPEIKDVVLETSEAVKLAPLQLQRVDQLVLLANKKLYLPQSYTFLIDTDVKIIGIKPYTQPVPASVKTQLVIPKKEEKKLIKSAVKLFLNLSSGYTLASNLDGLLVESDYRFNFDELVFRLAEAAISHPNSPIIYKLPDDHKDEVRGALRLLSQKTLLDRAMELFLFIRNKKNLLNVSIAIPHLKSANELLQIKRELAGRGISRKGALKIWVEMGVPENFINLESYLLAGIDGVILNLDELHRLLVGTSAHNPNWENLAYKTDVKTMMKFLEPGLKFLHKEKIPILAYGLNTTQPDILEFLIEKGIYGIVSNNIIEAESMPEHLHWAEKRMVLKKFVV